MKNTLCTLISQQVISENTVVTAYKIKGSGTVKVKSVFKNEQPIQNVLANALQRKLQHNN